MDCMPYLAILIVEIAATDHSITHLARIDSRVPYSMLVQPMVVEGSGSAYKFLRMQWVLTYLFFMSHSG